jgi:hypothetical protein
MDNIEMHLGEIGFVGQLTGLIWLGIGTSGELM